MEVAPFFVDFHHFLSIFTIFYRFSRFTHFCRDLHFVAIYALFPQIFFGQNSHHRIITRFLHVCLFPDIFIYLGSHRRIMGQKPNEIFSSESQTQNIKEFCKACGTLVHIRYGSNLKNLIFTFVPKIFPDIYMYIGSPKKFLAKNPIKIFSPWHRNLSSPLTWDF